ncbi:hypothetical protein ACHQM5_024117 [Ranunculus cassubicifolius]
MEVAPAPSSSAEVSGLKSNNNKVRDQLRVRRKTIQAVLDQCTKALQLIQNPEIAAADDESDSDDDSPSQSGDSETNELCDLLKSSFDSPDFLEKLGSIHTSVPQHMSVLAEEGNSWDMVSDNDLCDAAPDSEQESFVLVMQEDIVEGIACFMASYLSSLKETKKLSPSQLQEALCKTFSVKKKKGKLRKAWDGSKVIYNVASWGATAIGIYQNPALIRAASMAFWNSCNLISKLL